jgi:broad specificity phosphatase PhoE
MSDGALRRFDRGLVAPGRRAALAAALMMVLAAPAAGATPADTSAARDTTSTTTIVLVRHAEKSTTAIGDVPLSTAGKLRARELARLLADTDLDAIYVTPYLRNRQTGEPLAALKGDSLTVVDPVDETVRRLRSRHAGRTVCVIGHSNTLPQIIEQLTGQRIPPFTEGDYDRLYVVTIAPGRPATLLRLSYGATQPPPNE